MGRSLDPGSRQARSLLETNGEAEEPSIACGASDRRFRAPPPSATLVEPLDDFIAVFHRPSGATHLLVEPAPQILEALVEPLTLAELATRLAAAYDVAGDEAALAARVDELVAAGLIEPS